MTRDADDRARELLAKIVVNMGVNAFRVEAARVDLLAMLTEALREERERALEEAAKVADCTDDCRYEQYCGCSYAQDRIRALKGEK